MLAKILDEVPEIEKFLKTHDLQEHSYILGRTGEVCLGKLVELLLCNKFGDPLRLLPFQRVMLHMLWTKKFPMVLACRGAGKTFMIAVYCLLRTLLVPGSRIVIVSGGFRQAKFTFQYIDELIKNSPIVQEAIRKYHPGNEFGVKFATDKVYLKVGTNTDITGLPIGDGSKVRGMRATILICDEVASIDDKVFDTAIGPFLSVQADPAEAVMVEDFVKRLKSLGAKQEVIDYVENKRKEKKGNQLCLFGTASYQFNHFYRRWQAYKMFAESGGDRDKIKEGLQVQAGEAKVVLTDDMLDLWEEIYKEYAIFQLPYNGMPKGFLDAAVVASHKAMMDPVIFGHEYECKFSRDTNGFFSRSIVDDASPGKDEENEVFHEVYGDPHSQYVLGLDPARWNDNFGLVLLKLVPGQGAQVVLVDSWNKAKFQESVRKIRDVMRRFPNIVRICLDKGGGGDTIQELLADARMLKDEEKPIIEVNPSDEHKAIPGALRILEMVNFHTWTAPANHALKSDIILKKVTFPSRVDDDMIMHTHGKILAGEPLDPGDPEHAQMMQHLQDLLYGVDDDNGEAISHGCVKEIELMKDELCTIVQQVTDKGTETFTLPRLADQAEGLDVRRRDRYSALLLAAYAAREVQGHGHQRGNGAFMGGTPGMIGQSSRGIGYNPIRRRGGVVY